MKEPLSVPVDPTNLDLLTREQLYAYIERLKHELELVKAHHQQKMSDWGWEKSAQHAERSGGWM